MRALEITIWMILLMATPPLLGAMQVIPISIGTCSPEACGATSWIYDSMNSTQLQDSAIDMNNPNGWLSWNTVTFALTYVVYAVFWILFILMSVVLIYPAMVVMFHVPSVLAVYISIGVWLIYMLAYIQIKRGGFSLDGYR